MATRTISNTGGNWNNVGTWVEGAIPTSADDVVATATSGQLTVPLGYAANCKTMILTGYVNTLTITSTSTITVAGTVTLASGATYTGTGELILNTTSTITSNGKIWPGNLTMQGTGTNFTLGDNWTILGLFKVAGASPNLLGPGRTLTVGNGISMTSSMGTTGNSKVILTGGTWSGNNGTWFDLDFQGNCNVSGSVIFGGQAASLRTLRYVSGTITTTGSTLTFAGNSIIIDTNGMSWNNLSLTNAVTVSSFNLSSLLTINGVFTYAGVGNSFTLTFAGTGGMTVNTWKFSGRPYTINLKNGNTYTVTNTLEMEGISGTFAFKTTSAGSTANFNVSGSTISVVKINCTDINSSGGNRILNLNGTNSNTTNWTTSQISTKVSGYVG